MNLEACGMFQIKSFLNSTLIRANKAQPLPLTIVTTSLPASMKELWMFVWHTLPVWLRNAFKIQTFQSSVSRCVLFIFSLDKQTNPKGHMQKSKIPRIISKKLCQTKTQQTGRRGRYKYEQVRGEIKQGETDKH